MIQNPTSSIALLSSNILLLLLATDHDDFDYDFIEKEANLIVDSHNRFNNSEKVVKA